MHLLHEQICPPLAVVYKYEEVQITEGLLLVGVTAESCALPF